MEFLLVILIYCFIKESIQWMKDTKIQGGRSVTDSRHFPFVGHYEEKQLQRICTAILVDQVTAITAGHCVIENDGIVPYRLLPLKMYKPVLTVGVANYADLLNSSHKRLIKQLFIHPKAKYDVHWLIRTQYDIGAMKWEQKLVWDARIQSAPLIPERLIPAKVFNEIANDSVVCEISGWGELEVHWSNPQKRVPLPFYLQVLNFSIISKYDCCTRYFPSMYNWCMKTFGEPGNGYVCHVRQKLTTSAAFGDSGSPVCCPYKGQKYVVGMHVAGINSQDQLVNGTVAKVYVPGFLLVDAVMRSYIRNVTGTPGGLSNQSQKETSCLLNWILVIHSAYYLSLINV